MKQYQAVTLTSYDACDLLPSDHKPVMALFQCRLLHYLPSKEQSVFDDLQARINIYAKDLRALAALLRESEGCCSRGRSGQQPGPGRGNLSSNHSQHPILSKEDVDYAMKIPEVSIFTMLLEFETARFQHFCSQSFSITNSGQTLAHWRIANKLEGSKRLCKRWLHLDKTQGLLFPNETIEVNVILLCGHFDSPQA